MLDWQVLRDERGNLVHPFPLRPGYFDSDYIDTTAAVLRDDGVLLIYNGINASPQAGGDPRRGHRSHYPAQRCSIRTIRLAFSSGIKARSKVATRN